VLASAWRAAAVLENAGATEWRRRGAVQMGRQSSIRHSTLPSRARPLEGAVHSVLADRIETGTFAWLSRRWW